MTKRITRPQRFLKETQAVSPVIGTILMVAIAVMLAAGVYAWVTMFDSGSEVPEQVRLRATTIDTDDNGRTDWIRVTMMSAGNAPYGFDVVSSEILGPGGSVGELCASPDSSTCPVDPGDSWDVGQSVYIQCEDAGEHFVTVTIRGTTVLDDRIRCEEASA